MRADDVDPDSTEVVMEIADGQLHLLVEDRWRAERPEDPNHHRVLGAMFWAQRADASSQEVRQVALDGLRDTTVVVSVGAIPAIAGGDPRTEPIEEIARSTAALVTTRYRVCNEHGELLAWTDDRRLRAQRRADRLEDLKSRIDEVRWRFKRSN